MKPDVAEFESTDAVGVLSLVWQERQAGLHWSTIREVFQFLQTVQAYWLSPWKHRPNGRLNRETIA